MATLDNVEFFRMDALPDYAMEQVTHKVKDKGGIKPYNVIFYMVHSLCNCGKTVN